MREWMAELWRQRTRYLLLLFSLALGAFTVSAVSLIGKSGKALMEAEFDSMGLSGLVVTSSRAVISEEDETALWQTGLITEEAPLCYAYCKADVFPEEQKVLLWGITEQIYQSVKITLLHGRLLSDADAGSPVGMVDSAFARRLYGRENIVGREVSLQIGSLPVSFTVAGVVETGGALSGQLIGSAIPCFLYLPMENLRLYKGEPGFNQLLLTLPDTLPPEEAGKMVSDYFSGIRKNVQVQNMAARREELSGVLAVFTLVLSVLGGISLLTSGLSMMAVMLQSVREQTPFIGIKKALGANDRMICFEYLFRALLFSAAGTLLGSCCSLLLLPAGKLLLGIHPPALTPADLLFPALPGLITGILSGLLPAAKAAACRPQEAISRLC